ncbi:MAG: helix-turn-helix transcriptional regulator [Clostridia bacterium]|nr:helix-turn-helix transcriptional regulator [Clostridia bacterium]
MNTLKFVNAGYNVAEPGGLVFKWALNQHAFLYFQGPVIVNGKEEQSGACILYKKGTQHDYVTLKGFVNSYVGFNAPEELFTKLSLETDNIIYPANCGEINGLIFNICKENSTKGLGFEEAIQASLFSLLVAVARGINSDYEAVRSSDLKNKLTLIRSDLLSNLVSPPNFDFLLKQYGISRTQGYKMYSLFFKSSPKEDLIWARLEKARSLMHLNHEMKIYEIAELCGFTNIPHFFRLFKSRYGYTPKDYFSAIKLDRD